MFLDANLYVLDNFGMDAISLAIDSGHQATARIMQEKLGKNTIYDEQDEM